MDISRPQFNHIRLDTYPSVATGIYAATSKAGLHCILNTPSEKLPRYVIGLRYQLSFFKIGTNQEIASYLGEVYSAVEDFSKKDLDLAQLKFWVQDVFNGFISHLKTNLPYLNFHHVQQPDYSEYASDFLSLLEKQGLYNP